MNMKNLNAWKFSDAAARVDFKRIVREAEQSNPETNIIRVTVDGAVLTLAHSSAIVSALECAIDSAALRAFRAATVVPIEGFKVFADRQRLFEADPIDYPEQSPSQWFVVFGDHVGVLSDRIEVSVEVF